MPTGVIAEPRRPVLRYYGGKWRIAPWLISLFPPHRIYVEPYGGGASVLMRKSRVYAEVYNDLNTEIVNVFRVLRDPKTARKLFHLLKFTPFAREEFKLAYKPTKDPVEAARRTIIRAYMGFGCTALESPRGMRTRASVWNSTGFRADSKKSGTTPAHDWVNYPTQIMSFCARLSDVVIENKPALEVIRDHDREDTLYYLDPPYLQETRGSPRHEYRFEMTIEDHRELADAAKKLRGMVVISGYPSDLYDGELYGEWHRFERAALSDGAGKRTEVAWMNAAAYDALGGQTKLF